MSTEILKQCKVQGHIIKLPDFQLESNVYMDVKKSLELIGGKWKGGKIQGFEFKSDPSDLLAEIAGGAKRNLKKEYQFFGTPDGLADDMVYDLGIEDYDTIGEPSAGQGALIKAVHRKFPQQTVHYFELMDLNRVILNTYPNKEYTIDLGKDFLKEAPKLMKKLETPGGLFDKIIANPPFSKNQDIDHINCMWNVLKPGGRIVTLSSTHWDRSSNKKETAFREWIYEYAQVEKVPAGTFKESGTNIETFKIIINKPL